MKKLYVICRENKDFQKEFLQVDGTLSQERATAARYGFCEAHTIAKVGDEIFLDEL